MAKKKQPPRIVMTVPTPVFENMLDILQNVLGDGTPLPLWGLPCMLDEDHSTCPRPECCCSCHVEATDGE